MGTLQRYECRIQQRRAVLEESLARFLRVCGAQPEVRAVYVFGSTASGTIGPTSDLDVLVVRETSLPYHDRGDDLQALDKFYITPRYPDALGGSDIRTAFKPEEAQAAIERAHRVIAFAAQEIDAERNRR